MEKLEKIDILIADDNVAVAKMMKEFIEKLIGRLEEEVEYQDKKADESDVFEEVSVSHTRISMRKCYEHAIEIINELTEEYNNGWIPCSERLPNKEEYLKNDGRFIVTDGNRVYQSNYDIYDGKFKTLQIGFDNCIFREDKCVMAWQPLPQPYKEEGE